MVKKKYEYVYVVYTSNLCYGRVKIGEASTYAGADLIGTYSRKGVYVIEKERRHVE